MPGGMIGTAGGYQRNALSGFARLSAQEQQRQTANKQMEEQETQQAIQTGVSAAALIATIVLMA